MVQLSYISIKDDIAKADNAGDMMLWRHRLYCFLITELIALICSQTLNAQWQISYLDSSGHNLGGPHIKIDMYDDKHFLYRDATQSAIIHVFGSSAPWTCDTVAFNSNFDNFAVDSYGNLRIVEVQPPSRLIYIYSSPESLYADTIRFTGGTISSADIEVDSFDNVHLATDFDDFVQLRLIYFIKDTAGWHRDTIATIDAYNGGLDLDLLSDNSVAISSANGNSPGYITFCSNSSGSWVSEEVFGGPVFGFVSQDIAADGVPSLVFRNNLGTGRAELIYAEKDGALWRMETVADTSYNPLNYVPLSISPNLIVNTVFYSDNGNQRSLVYAYKVRSEYNWYLENIQVFSNFGGSPDLAIDDSGNVHVCYTEDGDIKYAFRASPVSVFDNSLISPPKSIRVLSCYPNPANGRVNFTIENNTGHKDVVCSIYDITGRLIWSKMETTLVGTAVVKVDLGSIHKDGISSGAYFLVLTSGETKSIVKFSLLK